MNTQSKLLVLGLVISSALVACGSDTAEEGSADSEIRGSSCAYEIYLTCPEGQEDECDSNPNGTHRCVPAGGGGGSCAYEIYLPCPEGQEDECDSNPNGTHRCVPSEGSGLSNCAYEIAVQCPAGQEDECFSNPNGSHRCVYR